MGQLIMPLKPINTFTIINDKSICMCLTGNTYNLLTPTLPHGTDDANCMSVSSTRACNLN
jgi:hypothetical protein